MVMRGSNCATTIFHERAHEDSRRYFVRTSLESLARLLALALGSGVVPCLDRRHRARRAARAAVHKVEARDGVARQLRIEVAERGGDERGGRGSATVQQRERGLE